MLGLEQPVTGQFISDLSRVLNAGSLQPPLVWGMIAAYFDESGTHDGSVAVTFAGYSGSPDVWTSFTHEWIALLGQYGLPYFHMSDYVARVPPYDKFSDQQRIALVSLLIAIINKHDLAGTAVALKRADFGVVLPGAEGRANDPYYMLMMRAMVDILLYASVRKQRVLFTFDRRQKVAELAGMLHEAMLQVHPWLKAVLSDGTVFGSKEEYVPLQAADLLAYESYRRACDFSLPERKSFTALRPTFGELIVMSVAELAFYSIDPKIRSAVRDIMKL